MAAKIKLDIVAYENINIIAFCAPMPDFRFIWHLNKKLSLNFIQTTPLDFYSNKLKQEISYSVFKSSDHPEILFVSNRNANSTLIESLNTIDFFLIFQNVDDKEIDDWLKEIKSTKGVTIALKLEEKYNDTFQNVLSEIEYKELKIKIENKKKNRGF